MSARPKVLVVDDGDRYVELFHALLRDYDYATRCELAGPCWECPQREGCTLTHAHDWSETEQALARHRDVDVVLLDVFFDLPAPRLLPRGEDLATRRREQGLAILERLRRRRAHLPVVMMTSAAEIGLEAAAPLAADEYLTLAGRDAFDARALGLLIERILARARREGEGADYVWGRSPAMQRLRRDANAQARTSLPLLVLGETGTGKSALAETVIHAGSGRSGRFVSVDLSALPPDLIAAELFGTARGAFSGAVERPGRFEEANGGTLFLDEIGNLPLATQRLLLLALQERRVTRLGENQPRPVDIKLVAATHVDLEAAVRAGTFRADLYARLNPAARLVVPPLRDRLEDLPALASTFVRRLFEREGPDRTLLVRTLKATGAKARNASAKLILGEEVDSSRDALQFVLAPAVLAQLRRHHWPGNIRELEFLIANATLMALSDALEAAEQGRGGRSGHVVPLPAKLVNELLAQSWIQFEATADGEAPATVEARPRLRDVARDLERRLFERLFRECHGDFAAMAARLLQGDPTTNAKRVRLRFNQLGLSARDIAKV
ncbi:MAG: sigma 54-interacting transcriptional regulator [Myxococcota bacterium]